MQENYLKTTWKQRLVSIVVAAVMLGTSMTVYILMIMNRGEAPEVKKPNVAKLEKELSVKREAATALSKKLGEQYFATLKEFHKPESFNAAAANAGGVQKRDLKVGEGRELGEKDTNYYAYYIGYCPDESIFDSSFDSRKDPAAAKTLTMPLPPAGLIEGWYQGMAGAKLGGVREIIIPGELAYKDTRDDLCGMKSAPLKFVVLAFMDEEFEQLNKELTEKAKELSEAQGE